MYSNKFVSYKSPEWGMGERYEITNRGKDEEIGHSTHLLRSMDEGNWEY